VDSLLPLACLLVGIALPVVMGWLFMRRGLHQLGAAGAYRVVAERLGLSVDTRGISLQGYYDDRRIWVGSVMMGHGPDRRNLTWGVVDLDRPLGLGLLVRRRGLSDRIFRRGRAPEVRLDTPELRRRIEAHGDDPDHVRQLLGPDVVRELAALGSRWPDVVITDGSVRVHLRRPETRPDELHALVDAMLALARALESARQQVPPPAGLADVVHAWEELADRHGLTLEGWLPALVGEVDGHPVKITTWRGDSGYSASVRIQLSFTSELGLRLNPQTGPDGFWSVGQDIQFGNEAFDRAFVVKGWDPFRVRQLLGPEVREALLALSTCGDLYIDDHAVNLRSVRLDPEAVEQVLRQALDLATALEAA
jgi:hypothetical protein